MSYHQRKLCNSYFSHIIMDPKIPSTCVRIPITLLKFVGMWLPKEHLQSRSIRLQYRAYSFTIKFWFIYIYTFTEVVQLFCITDMEVWYYHRFQKYLMFKYHFSFYFLRVWQTLYFYWWQTYLWCTRLSFTSVNISAFVIW